MSGPGLTKMMVRSFIAYNQIRLEKSNPCRAANGKSKDIISVLYDQGLTSIKRIQ